MRFLSQIVRTSVKTGAILLALMLAASTAEAAHGSRHAAAARRACNARKTTLKQFRRTPHNFGGPVAKASPRALVGLTDPTTRITHATETDDDGGSAAIQNDAPATGVDLDVRGAPVLHPIGLLVRVATARPRPRAFSPRSPRGPPLPA
jgi:hypothetical protein